MLTAVDHLVARVPDLPEAVDTYRRLGFTLTHQPPIAGQAGVAYAIFGSFYFEFRQLTHPSQRQGLAGLALRSDNLDDDVTRLRTVGLAVEAPVDEPITIGGRSLERRTATVDAFIPMKLTEHEHDNGELSTLLGTPADHPNTATALERTYVAVEAIDRDLPAFEQVLDQPAPEPELGTVIMSLMSVFYLGAIGIAVAEPRGAGPTAEALRSRGPGLFQVLFHASHLDEAEAFMLGHGMPPPTRGTRLSGESALLVEPENACGIYVAMAGNA